MSAGKLVKILKALAPQQKDLDEAYQAGLRAGLPEGHTPMDRAKLMGYNTPVYHGTKQEGIDEFKPVYGDGLLFTTPNPEFASKWIGKGARQKRTSPEGMEEYKQLEKTSRALRYKDYPPDELYDSNQEEYLRLAGIAGDKNRAVIRRNLEDPDKIHGNVMPLQVKAQKTFDPQREFEVMREFLMSNPRYAGQEKSVEHMFRNGDYIVYETPDVVDFLKSKGYDSMVLQESADQPRSTLALFEPNQIRSKFAAFNPEKAGSGNIMASIMSAIGLGGLLDKDEQR